MAKKHRGLKSGNLPRSLSVSLAGIRAGSALAVDSVVQRVMGRGGPDDEDSDFARREARRFVRGRLGENLDLRYTPEVRFYLDDTPEKAARIEAILASLADRESSGDEDQDATADESKDA